MKNNRLLWLVVVCLLGWCGFLSYSLNEKANPIEQISNNYNVSGFSTDLTEVVQKSRSSIVTISTESNIGSGFIYQTEEDVYVVSAYHVVDNSTNIRIVFDSGFETSGQVLYYDIFNDLALIKIDVNFMVESLDVGDSSLLKDGEYILCMGTPISLDYRGSVEVGMISGASRQVLNEIKFENETYRYYLDVIQLSSSLKPGYSGSPVLNMNGEVVAMVTMSLEDDIVFAIPVNEIMLQIEKMLSDSNFQKVQLGIKNSYIESMPNYRKNYYNIPLDIIDGLFVEEVDERGLAYIWGLRDDDIVLSINDNVIKNVDDLNEILYSDETTFEFEINRRGEVINIVGNIYD